MPAIGHSELDVFPLSLGANTFGWTADAATAREVLDAFRDGGGNFIDTADSYSAWAPGNSGGESETMIGEWLAARSGREEVVIATKVSEHPRFRGLSADNVAAASEESLRRLGSDHIDLYFAHFDDPETPLEETVAAFDRLVTAGKVRYVGISNYSAERIAQWIAIATKEGFALPVALQPHYNLLERESFERELLPLASEHGVGVIPYYGLGAGFLTGKYRAAGQAEGAERHKMVAGYLNPAGFALLDELEAVAAEVGSEPGPVALAWLRSRPTVVAPIASARSVDQVAGLLESAGLDLGPERIERLTRASDEYAARVSSSPDR